MKRVRFVAFAIMAMLLFAQSVSAAEVGRRVNSLFETEITPFWINTSVVSVNLSFSSGKAQCEGRVTGNVGVSKITATFTLERKNSNGTYSFENSWNESVEGRTLTFSNSHSVTSGYTYRLSVTAKVTLNGVTETVSTSVENVY